MSEIGKYKELIDNIEYHGNLHDDEDIDILWDMLDELEEAIDTIEFLRQENFNLKLDLEAQS